MELMDVNSKNLVEGRVSEYELDKRLEQGLKKRVISGDQWFRKAENWYSITSYTNPYKTVYTELKLLLNSSSKMKRLLRSTSKVFYGVGTGDTELLLVTWDLEEKGYSEICAVDVSVPFLEGFIQSLRNLLFEYPNSRIMFKGYNNLFEKTEREDLEFHNSKYKKKTHVCLGNTIGNFDQDEIFSIFESNMRKEDLLMIGVQLRKNPEKILRQYKENPHIERLIRDSLRKKQALLPWWKKLTWKYNALTGYVEGWYGDLLAFRSKKYDLNELDEIAREFQLSPIKKFINGECAICFYKKV